MKYFKDEAMKKLSILATLTMLTACGGGGGGGDNTIAPLRGSACDGTDLSEETKTKLMRGLNIVQSDTIVGCKSDFVSTGPDTYVWSNRVTAGFGVNLDDSGQVNGIFDFEDRVKCGDIVFTPEMVTLVQRDMTLQQVNVIVGCESQIKSVSYGLPNADSTAVAQYLNNDDWIITLVMKDDVALRAILLKKP